RESKEVDRKELGRAFVKLQRALEPGLRGRRNRANGARVAPTLGPAASSAVLDATAELVAELAALRSSRQGREAHRARIAGKRVRYAIEPFGELGQAEDLVDTLKRLQDVLGELHDTHLLIHWVESRLEKLPSKRHKRNDPKVGVKAVWVMLHRRE